MGHVAYASGVAGDGAHVLVHAFGPGGVACLDAAVAVLAHGREVRWLVASTLRACDDVMRGKARGAGTDDALVMVACDDVGA
jgi:hypothetical protein